jgi:hypothetical protein
LLFLAFAPSGLARSQRQFGLAVTERFEFDK